MLIDFKEVKFLFKNSGKRKKNIKETNITFLKCIYGFRGHYMKMRDVCMDFKPCSKHYSFVSIHSKIIRLGQN